MSIRSRVSFVAALAFVAVVAVGCKKKQEQPAPSAGSAAPAPTVPAPAPATPPTPAAAAKLTDPQIAAIVVVANQVDIDAGKLALEKSKNAEIKKFAERMITDHGAVLKAAGDLVAKLGVTPEETEASKQLAAGGAETRAKLQALDGDAFDRAYVDNEVAYHEAVIGVLQTQLIPAATNAELAKTLVSVQPAFDAHLAHAKQVQAALAGGGSAAPAHDHMP
jgi:putative membrane protein